LKKLFLTNNKRWIFKWKACCTKQAIVRKFDAENSKCIVGLSRGDSYEEELILIVKKHFVKFRLTYYSPGWKTRILILKLFDFKPNTNTKKYKYTPHQHLQLIAIPTKPNPKTCWWIHSSSCHILELNSIGLQRFVMQWLTLQTHDKKLDNNQPTLKYIIIFNIV